MLKRLTATQRRGALLLLAVLISVLGWRWRSAQLQKDNPLPPGDEMVSDSLEKEEQKSFSEEKKPFKGKMTEEVEVVNVELNTATEEELLKVKGIGPVFSKRIVKYRNLIGGFKEKGQLQSVYGIDEENYPGIASQVYIDKNTQVYADLLRELEPPPPPPPPSAVIMEYPEEEEDLPEEWPEYAEKKEITISLPLNLNTATTEELEQVKGIGPSTANNIVKYRNLIYFYHSLDQLSEVWGIRPENMERMLPELTVGNSFGSFNHIEVNSADLETLAKHKYLGFKQARLIVAYRDQHGPYQSKKDLEKILGIDAQLWIKLGPYLRF